MGRPKAESGPRNYVVRLDERGYFGKKPWTPVSVELATPMTAREARRIQNRMISHNRGFDQAVVEPRPIS